VDLSRWGGDAGGSEGKSVLGMGWEGVSFGLWDSPAPAEKALLSRTQLEHCILRLSGICYPL
jgi:hypothetical protein